MRTIPFIIMAGIAFVFSYVACHPVITFILTAATFCLATFLLAVSYAELPASWGISRPRQSIKSQRTTWIIIGGCVAFALSVTTMHWPLRISYALSQPLLNNVAKQVASGGKVSFPQSAGDFRVQGANVHKGLVCLWLDEDTGEPIRLVQGETDKIREVFSDTTIVVLDNNWCIVFSL